MIGCSIPSMAHNPDVLRMARLPFRSIAEGRSVMNRCFGDLAVVILDHRLDGTPPTLSPIAQGDAGNADNATFNDAFSDRVCAAVSNQGSYGAPASLRSSQSGRGRHARGCWIRGVSPGNDFPVAWPIRDASHPSALCSNLRTPFLEVIQGDSRNGAPGARPLRSGAGLPMRGNHSRDGCRPVYWAPTTECGTYGSSR